jgi:hypothetical protein
VTGSELEKSFDSAGNSPIGAKYFFFEEKLAPLKKGHARDCSPLVDLGESGPI